MMLMSVCRSRAERWSSQIAQRLAWLSRRTMRRECLPRLENLRNYLRRERIR